MRLPNNDEIFILLGVIGILIMVIPQTRVEIGGIGLLLVLALGCYYILFMQDRGKKS